MDGCFEHPSANTLQRLDQLPWIHVGRCLCRLREGCRSLLVATLSSRQTYSSKNPNRTWTLFTTFLSLISPTKITRLEPIGRRQHEQVEHKIMHLSGVPLLEFVKATLHLGLRLIRDFYQFELTLFSRDADVAINFMFIAVLAFLIVFSLSLHL